jgi:hypothetical protein
MKQYSFYSVDLIINGLTMEGFADSAGIIQASRSAPQHGKVMDARGKMNAITSADKSGVVTFDLLQTSDSNAYLQTYALATHDSGTSGSTDTFIPIQLVINDKMGQTVVTGVNGFITMQPGVVRGTGLATNTWMLEFEQLWMIRGQSKDVGL